MITTQHLLRRAVNGTAGEACRPLTAMAAGAKDLFCYYICSASLNRCSNKSLISLVFYQYLFSMAEQILNRICLILPEVVTLHLRKQNANEVRQRVCNSQRQEEIQDDVHAR